MIYTSGVTTGLAPFTVPQPAPCDIPAMRAVQIVLAAVMMGLAGGYGWSAMSRHPPAVHIPKAVTPKTVEIAQTPDDQQWAERALESTPPVETARQDPTVVEQSVHYAGCDEVRAAGKAPLYAGQPGYRPEMDGDGDGVACEPHRAR